MLTRPPSPAQALCPELSQQDLLHLVLELAETAPPLVFVSGYDRPRLVSTLNIPSWAAFIPTTEPSSPAPAAAELGEAAASGADKTAPAEASKVMVWPRRWVDLNAHVVEKDWDDCVRLVIGHLLDRSGISEVRVPIPLSPRADVHLADPSHLSRRASDRPSPDALARARPARDV